MSEHLDKYLDIDDAISAEESEFIFALYDLSHSPGTNDQRFSMVARSSATTNVKAQIRITERVVPINWPLFRARPGGIEDSRGEVVQAYPLPSDFHQHPQRLAGRLNYSGQHCLYTAEAEDTAVLEIDSESAISICELRTKYELRIADFTTPFDEASAAGKLLIYLTSCLAGHTKRGALQEDYLPTQMIAQLCREPKFDGLRYASVFDPSNNNIALFRPDLVTFSRSWLRKPQDKTIR